MWRNDVEGYSADVVTTSVGPDDGERTQGLMTRESVTIPYPRGRPWILRKISHPR